MKALRTLYKRKAKHPVRLRESHGKNKRNAAKCNDGDKPVKMQSPPKIKTMKKLTFEVHTYAPELNKVFSNGINITSLFCSSTLMKLTKSYADNCRIIRSTKNSELLRRYILVATRLDGSTETRFCNQHTVSKALEQYKKAKQYYSDTTKLNFKRLY